MSNEQSVKKRLQVAFSDEAWALVESVIKEANRDFEVGTITFSDVINEMVLGSRVDVKTLQAKRTDVRRSLRHIAAQDGMDLDSAIKALMELKTKVSKKAAKTVGHLEETSNG
jgi:hypothetical protein